MNIDRAPHIYVAAASAELPRAGAAMRELRTLGARVVGDWTAEVDAWGAEGADQTDEQRAAGSAAQLRCLIVEADAVLVLAPSGGCRTRGAWMEAGAAFAAGLPVVVSCSAPRAPWVIAWALREPTDAAAISRVVRVAHRSREGR